MTRDEVKKIVMTIDVIYPNWNPKDLTFLVNAWTTMLIDYTYEDIERALRTFVATDQKGFAPTVGQLINCVHVTDRSDEIPEMEAWSMVSKAISNGIYNSAEEFNKLPELVREAVGNAQNIRQWAMMDIETVQSVVHSNFLRAYKAVRERRSEYKRLPSDVRHKISQAETKRIQTGQQPE